MSALLRNSTLETVFRAFRKRMGTSHPLNLEGRIFRVGVPSLAFLQWLAMVRQGETWGVLLKKREMKEKKNSRAHA